jgi:5-(aminomethyl)-3-furanmethanol phosphate kinase
MTAPEAVVKVGGSLYDLPDLGPRLRSWLDGLGTTKVIVVPGGGGTADVIRDFDRIHKLGEERAHWLALGAVSLNGRFLNAVVPRSCFISDLEEAPPAWGEGCVAILDAYQFSVADEGRPGCLPHVWAATSDAVAGRVAVVLGARRLVMLKSTPVPPNLGMAELVQRNIVDPIWPSVVAQSPGLKVEWVNLRGFPS